ncbi:hypothetical protein BE17_15695 [Sorangium cellulosum]|uniref:Disintegrin domain-containing protein n=1 Tax=Sorangium cellulosum TaxID=56 RepID=A0A150R5B9_SORCE|nr:hypothetical protein BE17_15695 [Sorangium cellulosum]
MKIRLFSAWSALIAALAASLGACVDGASVSCGDGYCLAGYECLSSLDGERCVTPGTPRDACGNGLREVGEGCDDGNTAPGDGCGATCHDEVCGNGIRDPGEECDCGEPGAVVAARAPECRGGPNASSGTTCRLDCSPHCGDGEVSDGEECDPRAPATRYCVDLRYDFGTTTCSMACDAWQHQRCGEFGWRLMSVPDRLLLELMGVWGSEPDDVFAVGYAGVRHFNGTSWTKMDLSMSVETDPWLEAVWGSGPDDVFAVGSGPLLHYDGAAWTAMDLEWSVNLEGVWGRGPTDVFAVGSRSDVPEGVVLHYDGAAWTRMASPADVFLHAVWGDASSVFAVGSAGGDHAALQYDGESWTRMALPADPGSPADPADPGSSNERMLTGVWGTDASDVFAVGSTGAVLHYDGSSWAEMAPPTGIRLNGIWGHGPDDVLAAGDDGTVLHYDGVYWTQTDAGYGTIEGVWGSAPNDIFAVGHDNILHFDGMARTELPLPFDANIARLWGSGPSDVFALGGLSQRVFDRAYAVLHYDGTSWTRMALPTDADPTRGVRFGGVWGSGPSDVFVVGCESPGLGSMASGIVLRHDGASWAPMTLPPGPDLATPCLHAVWGSGPDDVFAVGDGGAILRYDGASWTPMVPAGDLLEGSLDAVWGSGPDDVFAVGGSTMVHYDGTSWAQVALPSDTRLPITLGFSAVWGSGPDDVFAVGDRTVVHYDGASWTRVPSLLDADLEDVWGSGPDDVFVVGRSGAVLRYDGESWSPLRSDMPTVRAVWGASHGSVFLAGEAHHIHQLMRTGPGP